MPQKPVFQTVPDTGEIESLDRDLRFHPVVNSRPTCLTADQIAAFNRAGYLKSIRVFDEAENACMRFLAGSHHAGHLTYRRSSPEEHNVLNQTVADAEQYGTPVDVELRAGEVSIHSDLLLHGSEANRSDRRRCGLTLRYCAADVRAEMDWNQKGVVVRGRDPSGHWANPPRPAAD